MFEQIESLISLLKNSVNFIKLLKVNLELIAGLFVVSHEFFVILSVLNMSLLHILCISMIYMPYWVYFNGLGSQKAIDFAHFFDRPSVFD